MRPITNRNAAFFFKRKPASEDLLVRQIRHYLMDHATLTSEAEIREWLNGLTRNHPNPS